MPWLDLLQVLAGGTALALLAAIAVNVMHCQRCRPSRGGFDVHRR